MNKTYKKIIMAISCVAVVFFIYCCIQSVENIGKNQVSPIVDDGQGHKIFKMPEGTKVRNGWVETYDASYHFDENGYLEINKWIDDEYYVDENGKMLKNEWYKSNNEKKYYLCENGKYVRDTARIVDGKLYAFDSNGELVKNNICKFGGHNYFFNNDGEKDAIEGWKNSNGIYYYVNNNGFLVENDWCQVDDKWYYFDETGKMQSSKFVNDKYYVGEDGAMLTNCQKFINSKTYKFDENGVGSEVEIKEKISENAGSENVKSSQSTYSDNWKVLTYSDSDEKYVTNKYYFMGECIHFINEELKEGIVDTRNEIIVDKNNFRIKISKDDGTEFTGTDIAKYQISILDGDTNDIIMNIESVRWEKDSRYVVLSKNQMNKLLNAFQTHKKINVGIIENYNSLNVSFLYKFIIDTAGFLEIYNQL